MRRWNGWGDETINLSLPKDARNYLEEKIGQALPLPDARLEDVLAKVPASRLPDHPFISKDPEQRLRHARGQSFPDWLALRSGNISTFPDGVAFPENTQQVRELLSFAKDRGIAVIPYGGGTSVVGHINPQENDRPILTIDMGRMNRLLDLDEQSLLATFGAGAAGPDIEAQLRAHGYTLGHYPQSFEYSTLGGWVATRSSGQQSLGYGRIERLFAGGVLETTEGTMILPPFPGSAAGPDLREILLGSEGRLGILTEIKVRIRPLPEKETFHVLFFPEWAIGIQRVRMAIQAPINLSMLRLSNEAETTSFLRLGGGRRSVGILESILSIRGAKEHKCMVAFGVSGSRKAHRRAVRQAKKMFRPCAGKAISQLMGRQWEKNRFRSAYLRNTLWEAGYGVDTLETATTWNKVEDLMHAIEHAISAALAPKGERALVLSHLSHMYAQGSSIYTTYVFRLANGFDETLQRWATMKQAASDAIVQLGATISHHHGVGTDHRPYLVHEKGDQGMAAIRAVCRELDPSGIMNPGKLV